MTDILIISLQCLAVILLADFAAGIIHWAEDAYIREDTPLVGAWIGRANTLHHHLPRKMTQNTWWQSNWDLLLTMTVMLSVAAWQEWLSWRVWLFAAFAANANEFHKWSHRTRKENGRFITWLQRLRVLQTPAHHAIHHTNPKDVHYCPITNLLNPVLDTLQVWSALEWLLAKTFGLQRQPDTSVPDQGSPPEWIKALRQAQR
jgi:plasmanylethanolamine desaturase